MVCRLHLYGTNRPQALISWLRPCTPAKIAYGGTNGPQALISWSRPCTPAKIAYGAYWNSIRSRIINMFMREQLLSEVLEALIVIRGLIVQKTKIIKDK
ncbi:hypothetical protein L1987_57910 [Smallanthus sonchifolius]|uniref:Uncharacterized protein n=1 Tax=Smallanthus sonchifolius TaxID=185202 RepID=A0ACB9DE21_9ASTR|nr:hypothetical protein L1987_57910 [Smallanthus sonchifolius]